MSSNPYQKRIAPKSAVEWMLRSGQLMRLTIDTETSGFVRSDTPYATPAAPFITEWGDCLTDFAGNYLNSSQIFPRRPDNQIPQPGAMILQRFTNGPYDLENPELDPYFVAMAKINWRMEQAALSYDEFFKNEKGEFNEQELEYIGITEINKSFTAGKVPGQKEASDVVIPIPLLDDKTGKITYDYRYHPQKRKISYRLDHFDDNNMYRDHSDGSLWKYVDPVLAIRFFNAPYDVPIIRLSQQRIGFDSRDSTFMYSRARLSDRESKKNFLMDTRHIAYATALYGPQGEDGFKIGEMIDPITGKLRKSEAQTALMERNMGHANHVRMIRGGPFLVNDGALPDLVKAHGAHVDAIMTASIENQCMDIAPWVYGNHVPQSDEKKLYQILSRPQTANNKDLELFSLPRKVGGISHSESLYHFMGTDDQMGRLKRLVFLHTDGNFHKGTNHEGKPYKDMSKDDWVTFLNLKHVRGNPDRPVRIESLRKFPGAVHIHDVFQRTSLGKAYRAKLTDIERDLKYIYENPVMQENIRAAQAEIQRNMRYNEHTPQIALFEDEVPHLFAAEVPYLDDPQSLKTREGTRDIHPIIKTIKNRHDNVYKFMTENDRSLKDLAVKGFIIDHYRHYAISDTLDIYFDLISASTQIDLYEAVDIQNSTPSTIKQIAARSHLESLRRNVQKAYTARTEQAQGERTIFDDLINPLTQKPFFNTNGIFEMNTLQDAVMFRNILRMNANMALAATSNFQSLAQNIFDKKYDGKKFPYKSALEEISRPSSDAPYFAAPPSGRSKKPRIMFSSPKDAFEFRRQLGIRLLNDFLFEVEKPNSVFAQGFVDKNWCIKKPQDKSYRLLFASADNGENGGTPHIADKQGRVIDIEYLKQQSQDYVLARLKSGEWQERFYRLGSEPSTMLLVQRFVDLGLVEDIPPVLYEQFYNADKQNRLWGLPNETADTARMATLDTFEFELRRLEMAATSRNSKLLEKDSNPLLSEAAKALQFEEGQRILSSCRTWFEEMKEKYPQNPALIQNGRHDPSTNLPLDYIAHQIRRDISKPFTQDPNFIVIDVPARHMRYPHDNYDLPLPPKGLSVKGLSGAIKGSINKGKPVIFREIETGRLYSGGKTSAHDLHSKKTKIYNTLLEKTYADYKFAGVPIEENAAITFIGIEGLYPLANTRPFEQGLQSFKLPGAQFDALTYPQLSAFGDTPITTLIMPTSYCPQKLEPGKLMRLRDTTAAPFSTINGKIAPETGHIYDTKLIEVDGMDGSGNIEGFTIEEICEQFRNNQNTEHARIFQGSGFLGIDHLYQKLSQWRADGWKGMDEKILVAHFEQVNQAYKQNDRDERYNMWGLFNALSAPDAALIIDNVYPSPTAYRDYS